MIQAGNFGGLDHGQGILARRRAMACDRAPVAEEPARGASPGRSTDHQWHHPRAQDGCRWQDCPSVYGPPTTIYNRFHRWARRGIWRQLFAALATTDRGGIPIIASATAK